MAYSKKSSQISAVLAALLVVLCLSGTSWAEGSAMPGRSVGHVFLGMDRVDVWKILGKPGHTATVPHGMSLYGEDVWYGNGHDLTVLSERDQVIQIGFNSPRITTTGGLSPTSTLAQVHRRYPLLTVRAYTLLHFSEGEGRYHPGLYAYVLDNMREGIAFATTSQEGITPDARNEAAGTIIIHRPGFQAVPLYLDHWPPAMAPNEDPNGLRLLRSWFTPAETLPQSR